MTLIRFTGALALIAGLAASGAAPAQSYDPNEAGPPPGYDAPQGDYGPAPDQVPYGQQQYPGGYGQQQYPGGYGQQQYPGGAYGQPAQPYGEAREDSMNQGGDYGASLAQYRAQQQVYRRQMRAYQQARAAYDRQYGPGAYEAYYAPPPQPRD